MDELQKFKNEMEEEIKKLNENVNNILVILRGTNGFPGIVKSIENQGKQINTIDTAVNEMQTKLKCLDKVPVIEKDLDHLQMEVLGINKDGTGGIKKEVDIIKLKPQKRFSTIKQIVLFISVSLGCVLTTLGILAAFGFIGG